eukprot:g59032.t1
MGDPPLKKRKGLDATEDEWLDEKRATVPGVPLEAPVQKLEEMKLEEEMDEEDDDEDDDGTHPIIRAIERNDGKTVLSTLLADPTWFQHIFTDTEEEDTVLSLCARLDRLSLMRKLLSHPNLKDHARAAVDVANEFGATPLFIAAQEGHLAMTQLLIREGGAAVQGGNIGRTPLFVASQEGHLAITQYLVREGGAKVDQAMQDGSTPLFIACDRGHLGVAQYLVQEGASVNTTTQDGATPLHIACEFGYLAIVEWLVREGGASVSRATTTGATPLFIACGKGHYSVAEYLTEAGATLVLLDDLVWQRPKVLEALATGSQTRLRPLLVPVLSRALGPYGIVQPLQDVIREYMLPVGWDQLLDVMRGS